MLDLYLDLVPGADPAAPLADGTLRPAIRDDAAPVPIVVGDIATGALIAWLPVAPDVPEPPRGPGLWRRMLARWTAIMPGPAPAGEAAHV